MKKVLFLLISVICLPIFSQTPENQVTLKVGDKAPNFILNNATGKSVELETLLKNGPVVLTWYRGGWCPYCNIALKEWQNNLSKVKEQKATFVALSPENPDKSISTAEKNKLQFEVLSDINLNVAEKYGVIYKEKKNLPIPATFVIDKNGIIRYVFADLNYRNRANQEDVINVLKQLHLD